MDLKCGKWDVYFHLLVNRQLMSSILTQQSPEDQTPPMSLCHIRLWRIVLFSIFAHWVIYFRQILSSSTDNRTRTDNSNATFTLPALFRSSYSYLLSVPKTTVNVMTCFIVHHLIIKCVPEGPFGPLCYLGVFFFLSFRLIKICLLQVTGCNKMLWSLLEHYLCSRCSEGLLSRKLSTTLKISLTFNINLYKSIIYWSH